MRRSVERRRGFSGGDYAARDGEALLLPAEANLHDAGPVNAGGSDVLEHPALGLAGHHVPGGDLLLSEQEFGEGGGLGAGVGVGREREVETGDVRVLNVAVLVADPEFVDDRVSGDFSQRGVISSAVNPAAVTAAT